MGANNCQPNMTDDDENEHSDDFRCEQSHLQNFERAISAYTSCHGLFNWSSSKYVTICEVQCSMESVVPVVGTDFIRLLPRVSYLYSQNTFKPSTIKKTSA